MNYDELIEAVFPAGAGVIPDKNSPLNLTNSFPRRCGGDPLPKNEKKE